MARKKNPSTKDATKKPCLLITGAAGGLALIAAERLARRFELVGIDPRDLSDKKRFPGKFYQMDLQNRRLEELFRNHSFDACIHLGRIPIASKLSTGTRFNVNVLGTRNLLELCKENSVAKILVFSSFHVYGAHQHNHLYISEDDPLLASQTFPEVSDIVEMDNVSVAFSLKHPEIQTYILRPVHIIGPRVHNQITRYLRAGRCPLLLGYDPLQQFLYEEDVVTAMELCLDHPRERGIFNISGEGTLPYSKAIQLAGSKAVWVPEIFKTPFLKLLKVGGLHLPEHLTEYFKYPVILDDKKFRDTFSFRESVSAREALQKLIYG